MTSALSILMGSLRSRWCGMVRCAELAVGVFEDASNAASGGRRRRRAAVGAPCSRKHVPDAGCLRTGSSRRSSRRAIHAAMARAQLGASRPDSLSAVAIAAARTRSFATPSMPICASRCSMRVFSNRRSRALGSRRGRALRARREGGARPRPRARSPTRGAADRRSPRRRSGIRAAARHRRAGCAHRSEARACVARTARCRRRIARPRAPKPGGRPGNHPRAPSL